MSRVLPVLPVLPQPGRWEYENVVAFAVMRMLALTVLVVLSSAVAQVPQSLPQAGRTTNEGTLNIKVDAQTQKPHTSPFAEYVGVISELVRAVAWPLLFGTLIITQRRPLPSVPT